MATAVGNLFVGVHLDTKGVKASLEKVKQEASGLGQEMRNSFREFFSLQNIARGLNVAIGVATIGIAKEFATFEKTMSGVKAVTGATVEEFEKLRKLAKEQGRSTVFSAVQAGQGMEFLGMAGFRTNQILEALPHTLNLAAAGSIELGEAADIASNIMSGFQLQAKETQRATDVLADTISSSNTNMSQMGEAMKFIAPSANALGVSIEETSAVIGRLGDNGLQGSIATQALSGSLSRLSKPTKQMKKAMQEANLEIFNSRGEFAGFIDIIRQMEVGMKNMNNEQKQNIITTVFGVQSVKQWNALLATGSEELERFTKQLENSEGAAQRMAEVKLDNVAGSFTLLKSALSGFAITIGEILAPTVRALIDTLTFLVNNVITPMFQPLVTVVDFLKNWENQNVLLRGAIVGLSTALTSRYIPALYSTAQTTIRMIIPSIKGMIAQLLILNATLLANPAVRIFTAISVAVGALYVSFQKNFLGIRDLIDSLTSYISDAFLNLKNILRDTFGFFDDTIKASLKNSIFSFKGFFQVIIAGFQSLVLSVRVVGINITKYMHLAFLEMKKTWVVLPHFFRSLWQGVVEGFRAIVIKKIPELSTRMLNWLIRQFNKFLSKISGVTEKIGFEFGKINELAVESGQGITKAIGDGFNSVKINDGPARELEILNNQSKAIGDYYTNELSKEIDIGINDITDGLFKLNYETKKTTEETKKSINNNLFLPFGDLVDEIEETGSKIKKLNDERLKNLNNEIKEEIGLLERSTEKVQKLRSDFEKLKESASQNIRDITKNIQDLNKQEVEIKIKKTDEITKNLSDRFINIKREIAEIEEKQQELNNAKEKEEGHQDRINENNKLLNKLRSEAGFIEEKIKNELVAQSEARGAVIDQSQAQQEVKSILEKRKAYEELSQAEKIVLEIEKESQSRQKEIEAQRQRFEEQRLIQQQIGIEGAKLITKEEDNQFKAFIENKKGQLTEIRNFENIKKAEELFNKRAELQEELAIETERNISLTNSVKETQAQIQEIYRQTRQNIEDNLNESVIRELKQYDKIEKQLRKIIALRARAGLSTSGDNQSTRGFSAGGYTGDGPASQVAGLVHKGEYVVPKSIVQSFPNVVRSLESLRSGNSMTSSNNYNNQKSINIDNVNVNNGSDIHSGLYSLLWNF